MIALRFCLPLSNKADSFNIQTYYAKIDTCEAYIRNQSYSDALMGYNELYVSSRKMFIKEIRNAFLCAAYCGKTQDAIKYATILRERGVDVSFFVKNDFSPLLIDKLWQDFIDLKIKPNVDSAGIMLVDSLLRWDQRLRKNNDPNAVLVEEGEKIFDQFDRYFFEDRQLPDFERYGVEMRGISTFATIRNSFDILLVHFCRNKPSEMNRLFTEGLYSGVISRDKFYYYAKFFMQKDSMSTISCFDEILENVRFFDDIAITCCCDRKKLANRIRSQYFLPDIETDISNFIFNKTNRQLFSLTSTGSYSRFNETPEINNKVMLEYLQTSQYKIDSTLTTEFNNIFKTR